MDTETYRNQWACLSQWLEEYLIKMRNKLIFLLTSICLVPPVFSCPIQEEDKHKILSDLCSMDDGDWSSNRLNEMIIMLKFGKLPPEKNIKGNQTMAAITCNLEYL